MDPKHNDASSAASSGGSESDEPKGNTPAIDPERERVDDEATTSNVTATAATDGVVATNEVDVVSNYCRTEEEVTGANGSAYEDGAIDEDAAATHPGVMFIAGPDYTGVGIHSLLTGYHSGSGSDEYVENQTLNNHINENEALVEAYTVPDDDEQAEIINDLQEQLGSAREELEVARSQLTAPVVEGVPVDDVKGLTEKRSTLGLFILFLGVVAVVVGLSVSLAKGSDESGEDIPPEDAVQVFPPVLRDLQERKVLRCGTNKYEGFGFSFTSNITKEREGIEIDLCKAIAAAALGSSYRYKLVPTATATSRFVNLASGEYDVLIASTTHTFDRDVHESSSGVGFSFSTPYLYGGMTFNGVPEFVKCADNVSVIKECANIRICSQLGTTWYDVTTKLFPVSKIVITNEQGESIQSLIEGKCNVIQGEQYEAPESVVRASGYVGPYAQGGNHFTKEPLAMVTRDGDPEFAHFVNAVFQSLLDAEKANITMATAVSFAQTGETFGDEYKDMYKNALAAVGNYGEIYAKHLESISPRLKVNMINDGTTGLLYSHPFGKADTVGPGPIKSGIIENILERGFLRCGIPPGNELSVGLDIEFCRAIAGSILQRGPDDVSFKRVSASHENISQALESGDIDVYAGGVVDTMSDTTRSGLSFSSTYFYEDPSGNSTASKAITLGAQEADAQWTDLVYWVVMATTYAEENGITQMTSNEMPLINLFGVGLERLFRDAILAVGNYGEMYRRVFGQNATRVGRNMLNASPFGPQHYPLLKLSG